ncbi:hypothetical protein LN042_17810, partial [Kitasatospora sp. RB6PN24]|nr:hypothetical protein [Kitasatospora humi]
MTPTIMRTMNGVSDGLRFRSRLAAWQNPSQTGSLGHAVLPSAPVGILRAVARPVVPGVGTAGGGGPELRYAVPRAENAGGAGEFGTSGELAVSAVPAEPAGSGAVQGGRAVRRVQRAQGARRRLRVAAVGSAREAGRRRSPV